METSELAAGVKTAIAPQTRIHPGIAPEWTALAAAGPLLSSPGWLRAMTGRLGGPPTTVVVTDGDRPVLGALTTVQTQPRATEFFDLHHVLISRAPALPLTGGARAARARLAETAPAPDRWTPNLLVMLPGYECVPVGPGADDPRLVGALVDAVERQAGTDGIATIAFLYVRPDEHMLADALAGRGYTPIPLTVTWELPVPPDGMTGYMAVLPGHRRRETTRELTRLADAGVQLRQLDPERLRAEAVLRRLTELRCGLVRKYRGRADEPTERRRLESLITDVCGGRPYVVTATADGMIIGFALFAPWGDTWHCLAVGVDYDDPRSRYAYFAVAFYSAIEAAADAGVAWLGYGQGAAEAKRSRGCVGTPLTGWVRSADPDLATALAASAEITALSD